MKGKPPSVKVPCLRVLRADPLREKVAHTGQEVDRQECAERERAEAEMFWAGRTLAMRHSARVAA